MSSFVYVGAFIDALGFLLTFEGLLTTSNTCSLSILLASQVLSILGIAP
jgi:hypothetical protein